MLDDALQLVLDSLLDSTVFAGLTDIDVGAGFSTGDPPELSQVYEAASQTIAADPANVKAYFTRGVVCQSKRWYPQALADFHEVLRRDSRHARAWLLMAEVLTNLGEYDKAKTARAQALALDPSLA
jgi:tetratricopeptide (TPR) repeat protein